MFALSFTAMLSFASVAARLNEVLQSFESTSLCDKYTTAIMKNNTAADQFRFIKLLMNTAQYGNYTTPNVGVSVPGILTPGTYDGHHVALFKYFDGSLPCINNNNIPTHITFLTKDHFNDTNVMLLSH